MKSLLKEVTPSVYPHSGTPQSPVCVSQAALCPHATRGTDGRTAGALWDILVVGDRRVERRATVNRALSLSLSL